jgi:hypothetical protein
MESKLACWQFNSLEEGDCILLLIFLTLIFLCCNNSFAQQKDSSGIFVANIEFDMLTMVAVKCEGFASSMPKIMKHRHIDKKGSLAMLDSFLEKVKFQKKIKQKRSIGYDVNGIYRIGVYQSHSPEHILIKQKNEFQIFNLKEIGEVLKEVISYSEKNNINVEIMLFYVKEVMDIYQSNHNTGNIKLNKLR